MLILRSGYRRRPSPTMRMMMSIVITVIIIVTHFKNHIRMEAFVKTPRVTGMWLNPLSHRQTQTKKHETKYKLYRICTKFSFHLRLRVYRLPDGYKDLVKLWHWKYNINVFGYVKLKTFKNEYSIFNHQRVIIIWQCGCGTWKN